ncbi:MAG: Abi family protein [Succiniclasticum sp.]|uniref:Abi family protein n=1 Tax=Succiniclasticum sp. TaxID=2775030 RepID=UPI002A912893|nr:Abi family protein [Succiniclasticum sp.]MDY6290723.1 Abi family protein [Succiniclasticum sp.]
MAQKKLLSVDDLITHMKDKGILFNIVSEKDAKEFLLNHNYYFKLSSYRKNYDKAVLGVNKDKYINLEFAYLKELSTIDYHLRYLILAMCLDIEHALKLMIVNDIANNPYEDGYKIVKIWDPSYSHISSVYHKMENSYSKNLVDKYHPNYPVYALLEVISFGELVNLVHVYAKNYKRRISFDTKLLYPIRNLRNACAHNACLINDLRHNSGFGANASLLKELQSYGTIGRDTINKKLKCEPVHDLLCLVYAYPIIVQSQTERQDTLDRLVNLFEKRMKQRKHYFKSNYIVSSYYYFLIKVFRKLSKKY